MDEARMAAILDAADTFFVDGRVQVLPRRGHLWIDVMPLVEGLCLSIGGVEASLQSAYGKPLHERDRVHSLDHLVMLVRRHRRLQREKAT